MCVSKQCEQEHKRRPSTQNVMGYITLGNYYAKTLEKSFVQKSNFVQKNFRQVLAISKS